MIICFYLRMLRMTRVEKFLSLSALDSHIINFTTLHHHITTTSRLHKFTNSPIHSHITNPSSRLSALGSHISHHHITTTLPIHDSPIHSHITESRILHLGSHISHLTSPHHHITTTSRLYQFTTLPIHFHISNPASWLSHLHIITSSHLTS